MAGPLDGVKVIELAGVGPGPMCAMLLADLGATVLRIDRKTPVDLGIERPLKFNTLLRGRYSIQLDLKSPDAVAMVLELVEQAGGIDALESLLGGLSGDEDQGMDGGGRWDSRAG